MEKKAMTVESAKQAVAKEHGFPSWDKMVLDISKNLTVGEYAHDCILLLNEVMELLDNSICRLTAELEKHRWIPVEEMLPIENTTVEVILKKEVDGLSGRQNRIRGCNYLGGYFVHRGREYYAPAQITHWRYLPELP